MDRSLLGAISIIQKSKDFVAIPIAECRTLSMIYIPSCVLDLGRSREVGCPLCALLCQQCFSVGIWCCGEREMNSGY